MRVQLLKDHEYAVAPVTSGLGIFRPRIGGGIIRYKAGQMLEVGPDRCFIVNGQSTGHRLSEDYSAWTPLLNRKECDQEQYSLNLELAAALDQAQRMEDRARDAEHEVRECKRAMIDMQDELVALHRKIEELNKRIAATLPDVFVLEVSNSGMGVFAGAKAGSQANQKDSQGTRTNHT